MNAADKLTLTVSEAAKLLGLSRNAAYEAVAIGELPSLRVGRRILIPRAALDRWLAQSVRRCPMPDNPLLENRPRFKRP